MISLNGTFSADVELVLHVDGKQYELGQLGPDFAILRKQAAITGSRGELETIIDGNASRWPVRITTPITGESRRFSFEAE